MSFSNRELMSKKVKMVFSNTQYPGDEWVGGSSIGNALRGTEWQDVAPEILLRFRDETMGLVNTAFAYYLPAFLVGALDYHDETDTLTDNLLYVLSPSGFSKFRSPRSDFHSVYVSNVREQLSEDQQDVVAEFFMNFLELFPSFKSLLSESEQTEIRSIANFWHNS